MISSESLNDRRLDFVVTLIRNRGRVLSGIQLLDLVWGRSGPDTRTVTVHIRTLRGKIEDDPSHPTRILTIRGVGYRFAR
jgi:two-component system, OmpR family, response regulator RegX3